MGEEEVVLGVCFAGVDVEEAVAVAVLPSSEMRMT